MSQAPVMHMPAPGQEPQHHKSIRHSRKKSGGGDDLELNMTSMIDVVFQLLVYFVVTASFAVGEGVITAKLPEGTGASASADVKPPEQPVNILLNPIGATGVAITLEGYPSSPRTFSALADELIALQYDAERGRRGHLKPDNPIVIKPDQQTRWQHVVNAFNATVAARYSNVAFAQAAD